jgi:hypothetical protein
MGEKKSQGVWQYKFTVIPCQINTAVDMTTLNFNKNKHEMLLSYVNYIQ